MAVPRYNLTENDVLYYLHIPKTAGTSFTEIIIDNLPKGTVRQPTTIEQLVNITPEERANTRLVVGHLFYSLAPIFTQPFTYITMLRDPVDRTVSQYAQIQRAPEHFAYEWVKAQSILEFAKDPRNLFIYANAQTRQMGLNHDITQMTNGLDPSLFKQELGQRILHYSEGDYNNPVLLERAQERLEKFAFVGLTERFNESIELLCATFGWEVPPNPKVLNIGSNRPANIPQEAVELIQQNTQFDAALYAVAQRIFESRYKEIAPERAKSELSTSSNPVSADYTAQRFAVQQSVIGQLQSNNDELTKKINQYDADFKRLSTEIERLTKIENSAGWRFVLKMGTLRRKLIPEGSIIESVYLKLRKPLA